MPVPTRPIDPSPRRRGRPAGRPRAAAAGAALLATLGLLGAIRPPAAAGAADRVARGRVVDPAGGPVAGARVAWSSARDDSPGTPAARTGPDGRFALPVPDAGAAGESGPGSSSRLTATAAGFGFGSTRWTAAAAADPDADATIRLAPDDAPIRGRILDAARRPIRGARVVAHAVFVPRLGPAADTPAAALDRFLAQPGMRIDWGDADRFEVALPAITGGDGGFTLRGVGAERIARITISSPALVTTEVDAMTRGGPVPALMHQPDGIGDWQAYPLQPDRFERAIEPTRVIAGVVGDAATGQPLAGWRVIGSAQRAHSALFDRVEDRTDAGGRYRLVGLRGIPFYTIRFVPPRGAPYYEAGFVDRPAPGDGPVIWDHPSAKVALIRVRVTDRATGAPVAGSVQIVPYPGEPVPFGHPEPVGYPRSTQDVGADGRGAVAAPPGRSLALFRATQAERYRTGMWADGIAPPEARDGFIQLDQPRTAIMIGHQNVLAVVRIEPGDVPTLDLRVDAAPRVELTILDPEGDLLGGAEVEGIDLERDQPRRVEQAQVALVGIPANGSRWVNVWHQARRLAGTIRIDPADGPERTIRLAPWGELRGRVVLPDGTPRRHVSIYRQSPSPRRPRPEPFGLLPSPRWLQVPGTDADGRFRLTGLIPGFNYGASILHDGGPDDGALFRDLVVAPGESKDLGDVRTVPFARPD